MDALNYEMLIRRIYQVGRYGRKGADADIYRSMEHAKALVNENATRSRNKSIEKLELEYINECKKVWGFVKQAIKKGIEKYSDILSKNEILELKNCIEGEEEITKEFIDEKIQIAEAIFVRHQIFPG